MSDHQTDSHSAAPVPADGSESVRAEVRREYAAKLAQAELKAHAAQAGIKLAEGFTDYLDSSKLLGEDGSPSAEAIAKALEPLKPAEPEFPQIQGMGYYPGPPFRPTPGVSLDIRNR
ncbi:hypothetical protein [Streptomyces spectabilis]|uniref:Uncharacterized protein n=1 Tax=Streptomyces spectabilis TaxID=68270 RepID=A0A5P2X3V1_STRST|nr:hypothetical protein [Streptomyces spectabilis]MBB5103139.1 hypothetical protein [Streptomyces spectabilis]MCI3902332.1 hypothetical protein [Streptomyces spectabilis]QEV59693.1 hypothetical protein CP982_13900 [Streptomyces spectabilis]GGV14525.1 hypothetical protein GCM10010245_25240 [Streptomyces spectabilis]